MDQLSRFAEVILADQVTLGSQPLGKQRRLREADSLFRIALAVKRARLGPRHVDVATDEAGYAQLLALEGKYSEAEALFRHSIETHRRWRPQGNRERRPQCSASESS